MRRSRWAGFLLGCLILIPGCVSVWWKAGAGTQELERDKAACRAATADEVGFEACMTERGWWHSPGPGLHSDPVSRSGVREPVAKTPEMDTVSTPGVETKVSRSGEPPEASPDTSAAPGASVPVGQEAPLVGAEPAPVASSSPSSPSSRSYTMFWKLGASTQQLDTDQSACLEQSGLGVERESGPRWGESASFDRCMCARGWRGGPC